MGKSIKFGDKFIFNIIMQNQPSLILKPGDVNAPNQKFKFWDTSITGNQRTPKNMSLVTSSGISLQNANAEDEQQRIEDLGSESNEIQSQQNSIGTTAKRQIQKIQTLELEIEQLHFKIQEHRVLNANLVKQLNKTTNQLRSTSALNTQLDEECNKLYNDVKASHDRVSLVNNQKMELIIQISRLNQQKQLAISKFEICEQQVEFLNRKVHTLHQQIAFQKSISFDLNKQTFLLKQQLNKVMIIMQNYSQLQQQVYRTKAINDQIQTRVENLQQQLMQTRVKVSQSQRNQQQYMQQQNKLFLRIQQLQNQIKIFNQKLYLAQSQISLKNQQLANYSKQSGHQAKYIKTLQQYQRRNQDLVFQLMAINQRNMKLLEQRDFYMRRVQATITNRNERLPYDQFVCLLRVAESDIQSLKRILDFKQGQLQRIQGKFQQQIILLKDKIVELTNTVQIREKEMDNKQQMLRNEANMYKKQLDLMMRRNQEIKSSHVKLRIQIMEKDRIIVDFIQGRKIQQQQKNRQLMARSSVA